MENSPAVLPDPGVITAELTESAAVPVFLMVTFLERVEPIFTVSQRTSASAESSAVPAVPPTNGNFSTPMVFPKMYNVTVLVPEVNPKPVVADSPFSVSKGWNVLPLSVVITTSDSEHTNTH
jgi:hypothetical protein